MQIAMNTVVSMTYELKDADGNVLESSSDPVAYLHGGYDNIFPKVEEAMHGKKVGDVVIVDLQPADAFGEYDEELVQIEPASAFPADELKVGMQFAQLHTICCMYPPNQDFSGGWGAIYSLFHQAIEQ